MVRSCHTCDSYSNTFENYCPEIIPIYMLVFMFGHFVTRGGVYFVYENIFIFNICFIYL
ncbi:hypothetical protein NC653_029290 [Populus alba x Populus x berolinensis]|uniref:Uncharacterized protein n=1 Tax=Populus alba x Populus x berolinensis TaxID=444605 RepID=A0AAD6M2U2_9ROSI|nr:hypothetical protein NC653_029290 [Populus alba x Populus x berolinensis]